MKRLTLFVVAVAVIAAILLQLRPRDDLSSGVAALKSGEYEKALRDLRPIAERGNQTARNLVGRLYAFGLGVPRDREAAAGWLSCYEARGCIPGENEFYVARDFMDGAGVGKDDKEADYWMEASVRQGYPKALECCSGEDPDGPR